MTRFPTATASPAALLMRLRVARHRNEHYLPEMTDRGQRFVTRSVDAAWDDCNQAGLAGAARVVMGIGETG